MRRPLLGDALALLSALFYALYVILLKVRIGDEERIDMQLFFGFVGAFNVLLCWPMGVILHITGVETFEVPSGGKVLGAILVNVRTSENTTYLCIY
jgi:solute carrier family 35 protein F5